MDILLIGKRILASLLAVYLVYLVVGALGPFISTPKVSEEFKQQWRQRLEAYNSQTDSPDRALIQEDNLSAWEGRLRLIEQAQERVWLSSYFFAADNSSRDLVAALLAAAERGVEVRLLGDGMMSLLHMDDHVMYYALAAQPTVEIRMYNPPSLLKPWTINGRLHDKLIIIDESFLLASGRNISDVYIGPYRSEGIKHDRDMLFFNTAAGETGSEESAVWQGIAYYEEMWQHGASKPYFDQIAKRKESAVAAEREALRSHYRQLRADYPQVFADYDYQARTYACSRTLLLFGSTSIMRKEPQVWQQMIDLLAQTEEAAVIQTPYAVLGRDMKNQLQEQAARLETTMYTNSFAGAANFFASADYWRTRSDLVSWLSGVYEFQAADSAHGKSLILDGRTVLVGSFNFDMRSAYLDTETVLVADCPELAAQLQEALDSPRFRALIVAEDGSYGENPAYQPLPLSRAKRVALGLCSIIIWPFRFLA